MANTGKKIDPLPDEFASEEDAAEFWDTHSLADYDEFLEPVDLAVQVQRRHFEVEVDEQSFLALRSRAKKLRKSVKELVNEALKRELATV